jgi:hypothetical protein
MKNVLINPENIINCFLPNFEEPFLCFIESGILAVNIINFTVKILGLH